MMSLISFLNIWMIANVVGVRCDPTALMDVELLNNLASDLDVGFRTVKEGASRLENAIMQVNDDIFFPAHSEVYVQYRGKQSPHQLWPNTKWNLTNHFPGAFHRVKDANSMFGKYDLGSVPDIHLAYLQNGPREYEYLTLDKFWGYISLAGEAGKWCNLDFEYLHDLTAAEVRPDNEAMRIWIKIN